MQYRNSQTREAVEYLWNRKGKLIPIPEWTRAIYGYASPGLQKKTIRSISSIRKFAESRGYGMLVVVHENASSRTRDTHVVLANESTNPKYTARELSMRQARALGFRDSRDRGVQLALKDNLLPAAEVHELTGNQGKRQLFLPPVEQAKELTEAAARAARRSKPQIGKAIKLAAPPKGK